MAEYLVRYWNGRDQREKVFSTIEEVNQFLSTCPDPSATTWKRVRN